ncbi:unnamed protein product [Orchesella dallaii]|uniref:Uncharacterized protein n=1 Tax=Orchesella dallaii TaxID=48710 RepID=A0ABP1RF41_9HEXA
MPKTKTTKKTKAKNPLTRGRPKKVVSEVESNHNEQPISLEDSNVFETSPPSTPPRSPIPLAKVKSVKEVVAAKKEPWEDLPDLVEELRNNDCGTFTYVTNNMRHREFELAGRRHLLELHEDLDLLKDTIESTLRITRGVCPASKYGKVSDAIRSLGCPVTFKDLVLKLLSLPSPSGFNPPIRPHINIPEPLFEESEEDEARQKNFTPNNWKTQPKTFPSPAKMAKYTTPKHHTNAPVFQFGTHGRNGGFSTNKAPRLAKPGEIAYSEGGSPIMTRRIPDDPFQPHERLEYFDADGKKIEMDLVFRGNADANKLREFKEFARDVRGIAATRSTVKQNRIQPARLIAKATSVGLSSASKKKPEWR